MSSFRYVVTNQHESESAKTQPQANNSQINKAMINGALTTKNGWKCFVAEITSSTGLKYETINIATVFTPAESLAYNRYLENLCQVSAIEGFFAPDARTDGYTSVVDEYSVYSFKMINGYKSLKELEKKEKKDIALGLYYAILNIIFERKASSDENEYIPLNCIFEDNIYISRGDDGVYYIKLLPMYKKLRIEKQTNGVSWDLFDAAYLYFNLRYPDGEGFDEENGEDDLAPLVERSLLPLKFRHPSLDELIKNAELLLDDQKDKYSLKTRPAIRRVTATTKKQERTRKDDDDGGTIEDSERKPDKLSDVIEQLSDKISSNPVIKKLSGFTGKFNNSTGEDDGTVEGK